MTEDKNKKSTKKRIRKPIVSESIDKRYKGVGAGASNLSDRELTDLEKEVAYYIAKGFPDKIIQEKLKLSSYKMKRMKGETEQKDMRVIEKAKEIRERILNGEEGNTEWEEKFYGVSRKAIDCVERSFMDNKNPPPKAYDLMMLIFGMKGIVIPALQEEETVKMTEKRKVVPVTKKKQLPAPKEDVLFDEDEIIEAEEIPMEETEQSITHTKKKTKEE